uniref:Conserved domain protein n=1 Tax=Strongyloides papillosus TaxID=174720 RepID=A0A0N5BHR8_STREA
MDSKKYETFIRFNEQWNNKRNSLFTQISHLDEKAKSLQDELSEMQKSLKKCEESDGKFEEKYMPFLSKAVENGNKVVNECEDRLKENRSQ